VATLICCDSRTQALEVVPSHLDPGSSSEKVKTPRTKFSDTKKTNEKRKHFPKLNLLGGIDEFQIHRWI
jgi:hypothetical protein